MKISDMIETTDDKLGEQKRCGLTDFASRLLAGFLHRVLPLGIIAVLGIFPRVCIAAAPPTSDLDRYGVKATEKDAFWMPAAHRAHMLYQDAGFSLPLPDGATIWAFCDSFYGQINADGSLKPEGAVSSTAFRIAGTPSHPTAAYLTNASGRIDFLLPLDASETWAKHRIWPSAGAQVGDATYLYFARVIVNNNKGFNFEEDGVGLAKTTGDWRGFKRLISPKGERPLPMTPVCALALKTDLYLYYLERNDPIESNLFLARVPSADAANPAAYQFWTGPGDHFSAAKKEAVPAVKEIWGQTSVAWNAFLHRYVMLHVGNIFQKPRSVYLRTAKDPWGPWSKPTLAFQLPGKMGENFDGLIYCAYLHPELFRDGGRVMPFTYCMMEQQGNLRLVEIELIDKHE